MRHKKRIFNWFQTTQLSQFQMNSLNIQLFLSALLAMYFSLEGYLYVYVVFLFLQFIKYSVHTANYVHTYVCKCTAFVQ